MTLTPIERTSALWQKLRAHYTERLAELRTRNDGGLDPQATARLRGQIAEVKILLTLGDESTAQPVVGSDESPASSGVFQ